MPTIDLNLLLKAPTQYTNIDFNSYANFAGKQLAVSATGLYQVCCGDDDDGTDIDAYFSLGGTDLGIQKPKVVSHVYSMVKSSSDMLLDVQVDNKVAVSYTMTKSTTGLQRIRTTLAKGSRGWYWKFTLKNKDGYAFDVDAIQLLPNVLAEGVK